MKETYKFHLRISELHFAGTANFLEDEVAFLRHVLQTRIYIAAGKCTAILFDSNPDPRIGAVRRNPSRSTRTFTRRLPQ